MPLGTHQFKFIVDNEWVYNPDLPTMPDRSGAVNNFVEIDDQDDGFDFEDFVTANTNSDDSDSQYCQNIPKLDSATKPPPTLPPHLMQVCFIIHSYNQNHDYNYNYDHSHNYNINITITL